MEEQIEELERKIDL